MEPRHLSSDLRSPVEHVKAAVSFAPRWSGLTKHVLCMVVFHGHDAARRPGGHLPIVGGFAIQCRLRRSPDAIREIWALTPV